jgi:hypothetical protein
MPRVQKYIDDVPSEKIVYTGKFFFYNTPDWNVLFPIVNIIRLLRENSILTFRHGKNQNNIHTYGTQYNHRVFGFELKNKKDYLENFRNVRCIYIFADSNDTVATNILNMAKQNKIPTVCYSNLDQLYHLYTYETELAEKIKEPQDVLDKMYSLFEKKELQKLNELFPEFDILDNETNNELSTLEKCLEKMNITSQKELDKKVHTKIFDPHLSKLKKMEYERQQKKILYDEPKPFKNNFTKFFKKN